MSLGSGGHPAPASHALSLSPWSRSPTQAAALPLPGVLWACTLGPRLAGVWSPCFWWWAWVFSYDNGSGLKSHLEGI